MAASSPSWCSSCSSNFWPFLVKNPQFWQILGNFDQNLVIFRQFFKITLNFADCVNLIKSAGDTLSISVERHIESYKGDIVDGKRHGEGLLIYKSGCSYEGTFFKNKKTGKGKYFELG